MSRISKSRHMRRTTVDRLEHRRYLNSFLNDRAATLADTGAAKTFVPTATSYGIKGASKFTFTGQPAGADKVTIGGVDYIFGMGGIPISADEYAAALLSGSDNASDGDTVTIGDLTYTFKTALSVDPTVPFEVLIGTDLIDTLTNLAAAVNDTDVAATGILTPVVIADVDTITIGSQTYTYKTLLSTGPTVPYEILVGLNLAASVANTISAINGSAGIGTTYSTGTNANEDVTASAGEGDDVVLTALILGEVGNDIATTASLTDGDFADTTLTGGTGADTAYSVGTTPNADVEAGEATISNLPLTAKVIGTGGNSLDSLVSSDVLSFADDTFSGGNDQSIEETRDNLLDALAADDNVDVASSSTDAIIATAKTVGIWAADIATTKTGSFGSWNHAVLTGGVDPTNDLTMTSHGFTGGEGPFIFSTDDIEPGGLFPGASYWINQVIDINTLKISTGLTAPVSRITSAGSGTQTLTKADTVAAMLEYLKQDGPVQLAEATDVDDL